MLHMADALPAQVTIDEIQRAPGLLLAIKKSVDEDRKPGRFILTGSANILLLPLVADSLAGFMEIIRLHPLTESEKTRASGGYPEPLTGTAARARRWYSQYTTASLARDVRHSHCNTAQQRKPRD